MSDQKNKDPFRIWNNEFEKDNPFAPHNGFDSDNPFKPWNEPFGKEKDLTRRERKDYGLNENEQEENY